jgi:hypothetical protein
MTPDRGGVDPPYAIKAIVIGEPAGEYSLGHYLSAHLNVAAEPLNPTGWDADTVRRALRPDESAHKIRAAIGDGDRGIVVGSTGAFATLAGQHALMAGGSAVDAALVTAFAQIGLCLGRVGQLCGAVEPGALQCHHR